MARSILLIFTVVYFVIIPRGTADWMNVSDACKKSLELYIANLEKPSDEDNWALQMWDASSKIPVGLLSYNFGEMGNFDQCIKTKSIDHRIKGKYCLGHISVRNYTNFSSINDKALIIWEKLLNSIIPGINSTGKTPTWAICLPDNCLNTDVAELLAVNKTYGLNFDSISCQTWEDANPTLDALALIGIVTLAAILYLMIMCTSYDLYCQKYNKKPVHSVLLLFSLHGNSKKLFEVNKNKGDLSCLHGIRVLSMTWIVMAHCFSISSQGPISNSKDFVGATDQMGSMLLASAPLACDTFLLIGGTLVVYVFFKHNGFEKFNINIFQYYFHRYLRITPALAGAVLISASLLKYMGSGPNWSYISDVFGGNCRTYWWSTLLYIQNYSNVDTMCVGHSWYLNIDFQLYLISPIFLYLLMKYTKSGFALIILLTAGTIIMSFYIAYSEELSGIVTNNNLKTSSQTYMNDYYLKTHTRAGPWLLGLILGYILVKEKRILHPEAKKNKIIILALWVMCLITLGVCVFGGHATLRGTHYDRLGNAFYIALMRPSWVLCIAWISWACANNYGGIVNSFLSLPIFQIYNKFTYSMYIIHVTLLYMIAFGRKMPVYLTVFDMFFFFFGVFTLVSLSSIVWVLAFESPMIVLEKIILSKSVKS